MMMSACCHNHTLAYQLSIDTFVLETILVDLVKMGRMNFY
jgi:hypothetical protein